jgi:hypothetical protein
MQFGVGEQLHHELGAQPDSFVTHSAPEKDQCFAVELPARMSELLQLWAIANLDTSDCMRCPWFVLLVAHTHPFLLPSLKPEVKAEARGNLADLSKGKRFCRVRSFIQPLHTKWG